MKAFDDRKMTQHNFAVYIMVSLMTIGLNANAELTLEINKGIESGIPIAIVPFGGPQSGENIATIVAADLTRTGRFKVLPESQLPERPGTPEQIQFASWKALGQDNVVIGQVKQTGSDQYTAEFHLFDAVRGSQLAESSLPFTVVEPRKAAHRIADIIYQQLTGGKGAFASRIAYVKATPADGLKGHDYLLQVADSDGYNPQTILKSPEPIMSPAWSPDGKKIAYVSFENKRAAIFVHTLANGSREKVSELPGINGAPAWSPDGKELAMTLSKDGNPEIYVMNVSNRSLRRITDLFSIDTEPAWSPDGKQLVFTSDRGGKPQLYSVSSDGGAALRITYEGDYNAHGVFSPDGKSLAMVQGNGDIYHIALMDVASKKLRVVTSGRLDETPGFAPNGGMIAYADGEGARLSVVTIDGKAHETLRIVGGEAREPAWSP